jgi:hypothetical protein
MVSLARCEPGLHCGGYKLGAVRPDMGWWPACDEQVGESRQHVLMLEVPCDNERHTFPARLIDDDKDPKLAAIVRSPFDKVVGPNMSGKFWPEPYAGAVI